MRVEHVMHAGERARSFDGQRDADVFHEMSSKRLGMTCVVDDNVDWSVCSPTVICVGSSAVCRMF
jgi:hypothetical protein